MPISVKDKEDNNKGQSGTSGVSNQSFIIKYNENEAKEVISHILIQYDDYSFQAQYELFLSISKIGLSKADFGILCKDVRRSLNVKFVEQNALLEYHVDHVMVREHTKMINILVKKLAWYFEQWELAAYVSNPDIKKISRLDKLIHNTMEVLAEFNLGTNVILFIQKKIEMLENKSKSLNIKDLNDLNKYDDVSNKLDNKLNDSSTVSTTPEIREASKEGLEDSNGRSIPQVKHDESSDVQGSNLSSTEEGSGGTQEDTSERARGAVF